MPLVAAGIGAAGSLIGGIFGSKGSSKAQKRAIEASKRTTQVANLGFGETRSTADGIISQENNQFTDLSRLFADQSRQQLAGSGQPLLDLGQAGIGTGAVGAGNQAIQDQFGVLQGAINQQPQFDSDAFAAQQFDRLQSLAGRGEEIAANRTANSLFGSGRLGANDTATGAAFEGLARAQGDARTGRALQATQLATAEGDRLFRQNQQGVQNQFGFLNNLVGQGTNNFNQLIGGSAFNQAGQQQAIQNTLGFAGAAGTVLDPNFKALTATLNAQSTDQSARAGVAPTVGEIGANSAISGANQIGNAFSNIAQSVSDRRRVE